MPAQSLVWNLLEDSWFLFLEVSKYTFRKNISYSDPIQTLCFHPHDVSLLLPAVDIMQILLKCLQSVTKT